MSMLLASMLRGMLLGGGLVSVLGQADVVLLLVGSMGLLVRVVTVGSSVLVRDLGEVPVHVGAIDLLATVNKSRRAVCLVDKTVKLVSIGQSLTLD